MLAKQVSGDEAKSKLLDKIARSTFRASEIVNSLLNFSRTSAVEFVDLDLNKVVRETITLVGISSRRRTCSSCRRSTIAFRRSRQPRKTAAGFPESDTQRA